MSKQTTPELEGSARPYDLPPPLGVDAEGRVHRHRTWADKILLTRDGEVVAERDLHGRPAGVWADYVATVLGWRDEWVDDHISVAEATRRIKRATP